jgi:hypothetical protein
MINGSRILRETFWIGIQSMLPRNGEMRGILTIGIAMETCSLILNEYQMPF